MRKRVDFILYFDEDLLAGFAYMIKNNRYAAILYLDVNSAVRGRGYGGQILGLIKEASASKEVILNIESLDEHAPNAEQRVKRLAFYEKNGFTLCLYLIRKLGVDFAVMNQTGQLVPFDYQDIFDYFSFGLGDVLIRPINQ